mgnify:CR=1 FL=1
MGEAIVVKRGSGVVTITFEDYKVYGDTVTRTTPAALSTARRGLAGASIGNYALFAGGYTGSYSSVVDAYTALTFLCIPITSGSKYKLNSDTETTATTNKVVKVSSPITGYIKYKGGKFE